jgi:hypothetical protein
MYAGYIMFCGVGALVALLNKPSGSVLCEWRSKFDGRAYDVWPFRVSVITIGVGTMIAPWLTLLQA